MAAAGGLSPATAGWGLAAAAAAAAAARGREGTRAALGEALGFGGATYSEWRR